MLFKKLNKNKDRKLFRGHTQNVSAQKYILELNNWTTRENDRN